MNADQKEPATVEVASSDLFDLSEFGGPSHGSHLLAPLRAAVEKAQMIARPLVALVADGDTYMPLLDYVAEQIETLEHVGDATHSMTRELIAAVGRRDGYDTWPKVDLDRHIRQMTALRDALNVLRAAVVVLFDAERAAVADWSNAEVSHGDRERQSDTHSTPKQP